MNLRVCLRKAVYYATERINLIESLARQSGEFANFEYGFLYDKTRHLQTVGYNVEDRRRDSSYYDLTGIGGKVIEFCCHCSGQSATGKLVCIWTTSYNY